MKRMITLFAAALVLSACSKDPVAACEDYIATVEACTAEAAGTGTTGATGSVDLSGFCQAYDGLKGDDAKAAIEAFDCASAAYGAADCSDAQSLSDAGVEAATCIAGG